VTRLVRHAAISYITAEPKPGDIVHTAASLALRDNTLGVRDWVDMTFEEWAPAAVRTADALISREHDHELGQSGFELAFGRPIFKYLAEKPERAKVFGGAMASFSQGSSHKVEHLVENYDWKSLGKGKLVDVCPPALIF
jgi:hypothetical protein